MSKISVFCITNSRVQAAQIADGLLSEGFSHDDISTLFPDKATSRDFAHEKHTKAPEGAVTGAGTGGLLCGTLGWLAGTGTLALPGVGPLLVAGPLVAALSAAAVGAAIGGIAGALAGMGIPEYEAKRYEGKVNVGNILISVHTESSDEVALAKKVFKTAGAQDIAAGGESTAPEPEAAESQMHYQRIPVEAYSSTRG